MANAMRSPEALSLAERAASLLEERPEAGGLIELVSDLLAHVESTRQLDAAIQVLRSGLEAATASRRPVAMPEDERGVWEGVGASFDDPVAPARARARAAVAYGELVERCIVGDAAVAGMLGVDRSRVSQRVNEHSLYAFTGSDGQRCFPKWQFAHTDGVHVLAGLKAVLGALDPGLHPLTVDHWFTTPNVDLGTTDTPLAPIEWVGTGGDPAAAAELAADL